MNIVKFSQATVLHLYYHDRTTTFKVNQVAIIDRITEINYKINSTSHIITKVVKIVSFNEIT